jgi:hypothetical protein
MCAQYRDYCERTLDNLQNDKKITNATVKQIWTDLGERFGALQQLTRADAETLIVNAPADAASSLTQVRYSTEARSAINLLGNLDRSKTVPALRGIGKTTHPDLAAFAAARLGAD